MLYLLVALNVAELVALIVVCRQLRLSGDKIHGELHPNHGASTRDAVDRLEAAVNRLEVASGAAAEATSNAQRATDVLTTTISIAAEIAMQNRAQLVDLSSSVADAATAATAVAADLAASHDRADNVDGPAGAAADAASQSPPPR